LNIYVNSAEMMQYCNSLSLFSFKLFMLSDSGYQLVRFLISSGGSAWCKIEFKRTHIFMEF